jgi:hypothetical protein
LVGSEQALELLRKRALDWGRKVGPCIAEDLSLKGTGAANLTQIIDAIGRTIKCNGQTNFCAESAEKEIDECPLSIGPYERCLQFEAFCNGICEAIDPNCEFAYDRMMTKGDKTCHWTIKNKGELAKEKVKERSPIVDPIMRLTNKFIDGEITEEEFRKKLAVLKELKL